MHTVLVLRMQGMSAEALLVEEGLSKCLPEQGYGHPAPAGRSEFGRH